MAKLTVYTTKGTVYYASDEKVEPSVREQIEDFIAGDADRVDIYIDGTDEIYQRINIEADRPGEDIYVHLEVPDGNTTQLFEALPAAMEAVREEGAKTATSPGDDAWPGWMYTIAALPPEVPSRVDAEKLQEALREADETAVFGTPTRVMALKACKAIAGNGLTIAVGDHIQGLDLDADALIHIDPTYEPLEPVDGSASPVTACARAESSEGKAASLTHVTRKIRALPERVHETFVRPQRREHVTQLEKIVQQVENDDTLDLETRFATIRLMEKFVDSNDELTESHSAACAAIERHAQQPVQQEAGSAASPGSQAVGQHSNTGGSTEDFISEQNGTADQSDQATNGGESNSGSQEVSNRKQGLSQLGGDTSSNDNTAVQDGATSSNGSEATANTERETAGTSEAHYLNQFRTNLQQSLRDEELSRYDRYRLKRSVSSTLAATATRLEEQLLASRLQSTAAEVESTVAKLAHVTERKDADIRQRLTERLTPQRWVVSRRGLLLAILISSLLAAVVGVTTGFAVANMSSEQLPELAQWNSAIKSSADIAIIGVTVSLMLPIAISKARKLR